MSDQKMNDPNIKVVPLDDTHLGGIVALDEKISGAYQPDVWESRLSYYMRRDPEASVVAEAEGRVLGFMLGEVRSGEFGLEEPTGWIEVLGVDPDARGQSIGRRLADRVLSHFRDRGAKSVKTLVDTETQEGIAQFFAALGFSSGSIQALARRLDIDGDSQIDGGGQAEGDGQ